MRNPDGAWGRYNALIKAGDLMPDEHQERIIRLLDDLQRRIVSWDAEIKGASTGARSSGAMMGLMDWFRADRGSARQVIPPPRGVYMYGGVGCGKTMLMDLFHESLPLTEKRRVHFHSFMLEVHDRLHKLRKQGEHGDPLRRIAQDMARLPILCFDEFQVTDVGDAMIMQRLFECMFQEGIVMVATSNRPPKDVYKNGLQRELFIPCIEEIQRRCAVERIDSPVDYRLVGSQVGKTWLAPGTGKGIDHINQANGQLEDVFRTLSKDETPVQHTLKTQGRRVSVPRAVLGEGVAWFSFEDLCAKPLGASDYMVIAQQFPTVFIDNVPLLSMNERNEVRRFITLIDTLYEHRVKLFASAAAAPTDIFRPDGHGKPDSSVDKSASHMDEVFAFDRTVSRLIEMGSQEYLAKQWIAHPQQERSKARRTA